MSSDLASLPASEKPHRNPRRKSSTRAEQQRAVATRSQILEAAISEFAERGFEAASIRRIADRIKVQHPLITYHFRTKDLLWRAAAEHAFDGIRAEWDELVPKDSGLSPLDRLRSEYRTLFRYTVLFPDFHRFMRQEAQADTPRLRWMTETVIAPLLDRLIPQISAAQEAGLLPAGDPLMFHYMMVSLTATLSGFGQEMKIIGRLSDLCNVRADEYWRLVDEMIFIRSGLAGHSRPSVDTMIKDAAG